MKIPEHFAREQMETSQLPRAPASIADTGQGLEAEALAGLGGALGKVGQILANIEAERQRGRDNVTLAEMKGSLDDLEYNYKPDLDRVRELEEKTGSGINDFKTQEDEFKKNWDSEVKKLAKGRSRIVSEQFKVYTKLHWDAARKNYHDKSWPMEKDYAIASLNKEWSKRFKTHINKPEQLKTELKGLLDQYEIYLKPTERQKLESGIETQIAQSSIENIKPNLIAAIAKRNKKEDGYEVLDMAMAQLVKDGILTKPEAAEANKNLGDWLDNYVSGRIKAAKESDKLTTIQSYKELSKPILQGELTYDDIENSGLRETKRSGDVMSDADRWREYIKGSYKETPTKNAPEGHTVSFAAVYDVATLQLSPKEGYDVLLEARFIDQSITNEQFEWAVEKIENPYSRHTLEDVNATLKSNLEDFNRLFASDNERNKKVNEALISWVDSQLEKDKVPTKKEMYAMSSAFRVGSGQPYDIGRVIERGGREWEIIGFDEDGEPLVELIE